MLEQDTVVLGDQQTRDRITRQIVGHRRAIAPIGVPDLRLRALEHPWRGGALDPPRRIDFIKMAERADTVFRFVWIAGLNRKRRVGNRKTFGSSVAFGIRARWREYRTGVILGRHALNHRS